MRLNILNNPYIEGKPMQIYYKNAKPRFFITQFLILYYLDYQIFGCISNLQ